MKPESTTQRASGEIIGRQGMEGSGRASRTSRIEIISPHNRDRFVLSRHRPNKIVFRALPQRVVEYVTWYLDGIELGRTGPPYEFFWEPTRGSHELLAVTPDNAAAKASFSVE